MTDTSARPVASELEALIEEGKQIVDAIRPLWREVSRALPRGQRRKYFSVAVAIVAGAVAGMYIASGYQRSDSEARRR